MLYGHVHDTMDEQLYGSSVITRETKRQSKYDEEPMPIPCNMIILYSDYVPLTLDEWIDYYLIH